MASSETDSRPPPSTPPDGQRASIDRIQALLKAKDDTSRFVGLALLKSVVDNTPEIRQDGQTILSLWESISPKFLDRLLRTGAHSARGAKDSSRDMLDLAVSVLHTFASILPDQAKSDSRFVSKIPRLISCLVHSSGSTEELILQTLLSLVSRKEGALALASVDDLSPLTEIAPSQPFALEILSLAWLQSVAASPEQREALSGKIDRAIDNLISSFKATDAVTLLAFLADLLRKLDPKVIPPNPRWVQPLVDFIRNLVTSRPTSTGRAAYTNLSATLLQVYPAQAAPLLFSSHVREEKPFPYLLVNLLLVDIRSSFPTLLEKLNDPSYGALSTHLASAFDIISHFIGFLVRSIDSPPPSTPPSSSSSSSGPSTTTLILPPDRLLALRKAISETMSAAVEYLRDRWDASVAGAMGLHPSARAGTASFPSASPAAALAWDSKTESVSAGRDVLVLAALRALAIWLREDDNNLLRREAAGLLDMFVDLYRGSGSGSVSAAAARSHGKGREKEEEEMKEGDAIVEAGLDFRRPVLVALEGLTATEEGVEALLANDGWKALSEDMLTILQQTSSSSPLSSSTSTTTTPSSTTAAARDQEDAAARGIEIVRVLLPIVEAETPGPREEWLDVVTRIAAWAVPDQKQSVAVEEFQVAVLQLATALLVGAHPGVRRRRYAHSTSAVLGVASQLRRKGVVGDEIMGEESPGLEESLDDVISTLEGLD